MCNEVNAFIASANLNIRVNRFAITIDLLLYFFYHNVSYFMYIYISAEISTIKKIANIISIEIIDTNESTRNFVLSWWQWLIIFIENLTNYTKYVM